jgi:hypothetical protein
MRKRPRSREGVAGFGPSEHRRRVSVSPSPTRRSSTLITHSRITASSRTGALKTAREYGMLRGMPLLTGCFQHGGKGRGALGWSLSSAGLNKQVTVQEDSTSKTAKTTLAKLEKQEYFGRSESGRAARTPVEKARRRGARPTANRCDVILVVVPYRARGNFGD